MRLPRFFCRPEDLAGGRVTLPAAEARHAVRVLRLAAGDRLLVLDGSGQEHEAVVEEAGEGGVRAAIIATRPRASEPSREFHLLQGLAKGEKMDLIVQKATELGANRIVPVLAERSVSRPEAGRGEAKAARWQRIAQEAAKQAGRAVVPEVGSPQALDEALKALPSGCALIVPWEGERRRTLAEAVATLAPGVPVAVLIGPEGGLSETETAFAEARGGLSVTLGPRILRTETAGLVTLACLLFATGNLE